MLSCGRDADSVVRIDLISFFDPLLSKPARSAILANPSRVLASLNPCLGTWAPFASSAPNRNWVEVLCAGIRLFCSVLYACPRLSFLVKLHLVWLLSQ